MSFFAFYRGGSWVQKREVTSPKSHSKSGELVLNTNFCALSSSTREAGPRKTGAELSTVLSADHAKILDRPDERNETVCLGGDLILPSTIGNNV